jgi:hypothetical protein
MPSRIRPDVCKALAPIRADGVEVARERAASYDIKPDGRRTRDTATLPNLLGCARDLREASPHELMRRCKSVNVGDNPISECARLERGAEVARHGKRCFTTLASLRARTPFREGESGAKRCIGRNG